MDSSNLNKSGGGAAARVLSLPGGVLRVARARRMYRWPWFSIIILSLALLVAVFATQIAPYRPTTGDLRARLKPPVWQAESIPGHVLGTDTFGRDILSRLIHGARISMYVVGIGGLVSAGTGALLGVLGGYFGGWFDRIVMRFVDVSLALPAILFALVMALILGAGLVNIIIVITMIYWGRFARQVRGDVLSVKEREYVLLARAAGAGPIRIMVRHIFPNVQDNLLVMATLVAGHLILLESTLSFLGVGIPPPSPSWGSMVAEGKDVLARAWFVSVLPGLAMLVIVMAANLLGDWLRDNTDPRLRNR